MKIHYRKAGNGCEYASSPQLYRNLMISDDMDNVTCSRCKNYIKKHNLKYRQEFPAIPTFKPESDGKFAIFQCPVCGIRHSHKWASGHRSPHCDCWENSYYLDCSSSSIAQTSPETPTKTPHRRCKTQHFFRYKRLTSFFPEALINGHPHAALAFFETAGREMDVIALLAGKEVSNYHDGKFAAIYIILNFGDVNIYNVFLSLGAPAIKNVLRLWKETRRLFLLSDQRQRLDCL